MYWKLCKLLQCPEAEHGCVCACNSNDIVLRFTFYTPASVGVVRPSGLVGIVPPHDTFPPHCWHLTLYYVIWNCAPRSFVMCFFFLFFFSRCAPPGSKFFSVKCTPSVQHTISPPPQESSHLSPIPLSGDSMVTVRMSHPSETENDSKVK